MRADTRKELRATCQVRAKTRLLASGYPQGSGHNVLKVREDAKLLASGYSQGTAQLELPPLDLN